jgi:hypothetical protein
MEFSGIHVRPASDDPTTFTVTVEHDRDGRSSVAATELRPGGPGCGAAQFKCGSLTTSSTGHGASGAAAGAGGEGVSMSEEPGSVGLAEGAVVSSPSGDMVERWLRRAVGERANREMS